MDLSFSLPLLFIDRSKEIQVTLRPSIGLSVVFEPDPTACAFPVLVRQGHP